MKVIDKILANIVLAFLLTSCYFLLPVTLIAAFTLQGFESLYLRLVKLIQSGYHEVTSKSLRLVIIPAMMVVMTAIYSIKSRCIDITNLTSPRANIQRLKATWDSAVDLALLPINQAFPNRTFVHIDRGWSWVKHHDNPEAAQELRVNTEARRLVEEPVIQEPIVHEEVPPQEPEVFQEPPVEEPDIVQIPARVRTEEEQRLHRCMEDLEALDAEGLPATMTMEEAMLLVMTRRAAANGRGVVCYSLSERESQYGHEHRPEIHQHQILHPHNMYYRLHTSRGNIFRPDEPDCAICFSPLVEGEAMVTHDTCRRTFHEVCYDESLRRSRSCPFDRERFVARSVVHRNPVPIGPATPGGTQQPLADYLTPPQDVRDAMVQRLQLQAQLPPPQARHVGLPYRIYTDRPLTAGGAPLLDGRHVLDPVPTGGRVERPTANPPAPAPPRGIWPDLFRQQESQAQPPQRVQTNRGRPGNVGNQADAPRNTGRPANRRQSNTARPRAEARRAWR